MRTIFWMVVLFGAYIWVMTSGHEGFVIEKGKMAYQALVSWFDDAEVDFQVDQKDKQKSSNNKKRTRRWD